MTRILCSQKLRRKWNKKKRRNKTMLESLSPLSELVRNKAKENPIKRTFTLRRWTKINCTLDSPTKRIPTLTQGITTLGIPFPIKMVPNSIQEITSPNNPTKSFRTNGITTLESKNLKFPALFNRDPPRVLKQDSVEDHSNQDYPTLRVWITPTP